MNPHPFDLLMELDDSQIHLDCASLHLAADRYPDLRVDRHLAQLDGLAAQVAARRPGLDAGARYTALREVLVDECGFRGDQRGYYSDSNAYLNRVLERRAGMPIALAIVWIEVGRRLKWPVEGVGLPGHFVVRVDDPDRFIIVDVFNGGVTLALKQCREIARRASDEKKPFRAAMLAPLGVRAILMRLLRNLRNIYLAESDYAAARRVVERMAAVEPEVGAHHQDLAAICCRIGDVRRAYWHLATYLRRMPDAPDADNVRDNLRVLGAALAAMN